MYLSDKLAEESDYLYERILKNVDSKEEIYKMAKRLEEISDMSMTKEEAREWNDKDA